MSRTVKIAALISAGAIAVGGMAACTEVDNEPGQTDRHRAGGASEEGLQAQALGAAGERLRGQRPSEGWRATSPSRRSARRA